jgi:two-component system response regulator YesN
MSITECNDGNEALSALQSLTPDLVITDLHMPACDGKNLLIGIRKLGFKFPIIVLSGTCRESDRKDFINAGFADCLQKGSTPTTLFKSIQDALSVK